jgi:hypothetical protein
MSSRNESLPAAESSLLRAFPWAALSPVCTDAQGIARKKYRKSTAVIRSKFSACLITTVPTQE